LFSSQGILKIQTKERLVISFSLPLYLLVILTLIHIVSRDEDICKNQISTWHLENYLSAKIKTLFELIENNHQILDISRFYASVPRMPIPNSHYFLKLKLIIIIRSVVDNKIWTFLLLEIFFQSGKYFFPKIL